MQTSNKFHPWFHRYLLFLLLCTFILITAGGLVTSTQSGLSVPDWPTTYGHFMFAFPLDQMVGGIVFEHSHRMIASVVGFLTVILVFWAWRSEQRRWVRNLTYTALAAVIAQGVLGGLTVLFLLPTPLSVGHATLAQSYFALIAILALVTSRWWLNTGDDSSSRRLKNPLTGLAMMSTAAVLIQLIIGAWMRHSDAGLAVPDFPLAYGSLLPSLAPGDLERYTSTLIAMDLRSTADGTILPSQIIVHLLHRYWALVTAGFLIALTVRLFRNSANNHILRRFALIVPVLIALQIALGAFTVLTQKSVSITTAHVVTGALLLVVTSVITAVSIRLGGKPVQKTVHAFRPEEAAA
jgi:heme a synthase